METNETMDLVPTEETAEPVCTENSAMSTIAATGVVGVASIMTWEFVIKPGYRWLKGKFKEARAAKDQKDKPDIVDADKAPENED